MSVTLSQYATQCVAQYQASRIREFAALKLHITGPKSPLKRDIIAAAKQGFVRVDFDLDYHNRNYLLESTVRFNEQELDELIVVIAEYLESQGFNFNINGYLVTVTWNLPEPSEVKQHLP